MVRVFITGITSGIGRVVFERFLDGGADVVGVVRSDSQKKDLLRKYPQNLTLHVVELSHRSKVQSMITKVKGEKFDYVILNAGYADVGRFHTLSEKSLDDILETNLLTNMRITHALLPNALAHNTKFVFVSSLLARIPFYDCASYSTSKAGLSHFYSSLALEYPQLPLLCVEIGGVKTQFHKKAKMGISGQHMKSEDLMGNRLYDAILRSTGVVTLAFDWWILRKLCMALEDFAITVMKRIHFKR